MTDSKSMYRTHQVWIKPGHRLFTYLDLACQNAKNLYNTTNFYIRQVLTSFGQKESLQPLQQQVMILLAEHIDAMNERLREKNRSRPFKLPTEEKPFVSYNFLDALFKVIDQSDYRALPTQSSQGIMKIAFQNWVSFFASMKDYRKHPRKYSGKPRIPGYVRSKVKEVVFSNQDCVIKEKKFLKLPKTKLQLNIGKLGCTGGQLKQVRVIPRYGQYIVELVFAYPEVKKEAAKEYALAIDLGVENLATIVTTTGSKPMLVKGKIIKAINQYYNKMKAHYTGILRQGKKPSEGVHTSRRLERLHLKRHRRIKDLFHKVSRHIVQLAVEQQIGTIVIGHNDGWKQASAIGRRNNQSFCHIPHQMLIGMIQYKGAEQGITVTLTEEAYTSKASFLDQDPLPRYDEEGEWIFTGKRIHRGLYASTRGLIHADVNGAANILRKVFPYVSTQGTDGIEGLDGYQTINVSTPLVLSILK
ncbi:RNA-guided endonuclease InsQ/TnpB family protein [Paenibacillus arenilitoris]|uniref:IS200/IS605 family element transposase accessory protein TnpB n=1 Tax=Paenibacillus arenilitoris TaxID=2772299 RepID=A0A927CLM2_9BACL|nr:RNA-guided endonuclease TnpB family protein [Paenibacillus arenilitoris]MBD2868853.1 IS200/IS605 family element transposase accessory protein TnpB [Paenibacillus arenilitoris]